MAIKTNKIKSLKNKSSTRKQKQAGGADRYGYIKYHDDSDLWSTTKVYVPTQLDETYFEFTYLLDQFRKRLESEGKTEKIICEYCNENDYAEVQDALGILKCDVIGATGTEVVQNYESINLIRIKSDLQIYNSLSKIPMEDRFTDDGYLYIITYPGGTPHCFKYCKIPSGFDFETQKIRRVIAPNNNEGLGSRLIEGED